MSDLLYLLVTISIPIVSPASRHSLVTILCTDGIFVLRTKLGPYTPPTFNVSREEALKAQESSGKTSGTDTTSIFCGINI